MGLSSNIFSIEINFDHFQIQRIPWEDGKLEDLRHQYNQKYSFFRSGEFIYISPGEFNLPTLGQLTTLKIEDEPLLVSSLIRHIFFRNFKAKFPHIKPSFNPFTFPSTKDSHNLIVDLLPETLKTSISYKKLNEIFIRTGEANGKNVFLLIINSSYKWALRQNCLLLTEKGFDITGLEVAKLVRYEHSNDVVAPSFETLGRVQSVLNLEAKVGANGEDLTLPLKELYLNKSYENIKLFLEFSVGVSAASSILHNVKQLEYSRNDPNLVYNEIGQLSSVLAKFDYINGDGFCFRIGRNGTVNFPNFQLENPKYLFDVSFSKTDTSPSKGLNLFGPYDFGKFFEISRPKVLVVYHKNSSGAFTQFLGRLKDGFNESNTFSTGFLAKYRLQGMEFHCVEVDCFAKEVFLTAIKKAIESFEGNFDVAIIETKEEFKKNAPSDDLYWITKAYLLQRGITVQFIKEINARNPKFILDSFALQLYAKLGGTPWILPSSPNIAHELIIGIGSAFIRSNNYSKSDQHRVVGITTFFNSDGKYILSNRSKEVAYEDYFQELLSSLKGSIDLISAEQGWSDGEIVRIIFHVFKPMKDLEVDVVNKLVSEYPKFDIKFCFVSFGEHHPFIVFDLNQKGFSSKFSNTTRGSLVPARGVNLLIDCGVCLLQLKGPNDVKTDKQGFIGPLLVKIHRKSTFTDSAYIIQQVFRLTNISYKSFNPSQLPVTLLYASLITEQLNKLKTVEGWDPISIKQLRNKKWFI